MYTHDTATGRGITLAASDPRMPAEPTSVADPTDPTLEGNRAIDYPNRAPAGTMR